MKSNNTPNQDTGCRTSVAMRNATVQQPLTTVSGNSNPTILMLQAEAGFISKHNIPFRCSCSSFITPLVVQTPVVSCQGLNKAMDALRTFHSAANGVEWYERTPNDAQQDESVMLCS
ncbi:hypothetical protein TNCV_238231 [Trichonephila clavipes]|nr:hypothetical protein TNCV_238231 [Trichonephila clavipes]